MHGDATTELCDNGGHLEMTFVRDPLRFSWCYFDYDVEVAWAKDGGSDDTLPSTPAPVELVQRLRTVAAAHGVPCLLDTPDIVVAPNDAEFDEAYGRWVLTQGPQDA